MFLDVGSRKRGVHIYYRWLLTVSGPTTLAGGGICRNGLRSSGPGLFLDKRFRTAVWDAKLPAKPPLPIGLAAKSSPCFNENNFNAQFIIFIQIIIGIKVW